MVQLHGSLQLMHQDPVGRMGDLFTAQGRIQGGPWGPRPPWLPKMRPQHQNSTKLRPRMAVLGPKIIIFFQKFKPRFARHKLLTYNYLNFSRLATLAIVLCI